MESSLSIVQILLNRKRVRNIEKAEREEGIEIFKEGNERLSETREKNTILSSTLKV